MRRYEDIGNFWSERRAGNTEADVEQREAQQTLKAARRQGHTYMRVLIVVLAGKEA